MFGYIIWEKKVSKQMMFLRFFVLLINLLLITDADVW